jgi:hypothetical protein
MADSPPERETASELRRGASRRRSADEDYVSTTTDVARDLTRLAFAWTQAGAHALFDTVGVVNNLAADVTDSVIDSLAPRRDEDEGDARPAARGRSFSRRGGPPVLDQVNSSVSRALRDAADVISRTADDFTRAYDDEVAGDEAADGTPRAKKAGTRSVKVEASASKS